jgi:hypothetical protein
LSQPLATRTVRPELVEEFARTSISNGLCTRAWRIDADRQAAYNESMIAQCAQRRNTMNAVITERLRVDAHHAVHIVDPRLVPGEEVEVIVRPAQKAGSSFLKTALAMNLDLPADYSVTYEDHIRGR